MKQISFYAALAGYFVLGIGGVSGQTSSAEAPDHDGLRRISAHAFPIPAESRVLARCDFESGAKLPDGWSQGGGAVVSDTTAPQGKSYLRLKAKKSGALRGPVIAAPPGKPCFLSYWIKTPQEPWTTITFTSKEREPSFSHIQTPFYYDDFPLNTGGQWRQEGFYFVMPPQCSTLQISTNSREDHPDSEFVCLDDVCLRTATEEEMAAAYAQERAHLPSYHLTPQPNDGSHLPLSVAKWQGRAGIPGKPFVIWALGSSFTDRQGDGYELIRAIRERFPHAPPILYRKHGGPGEPWEFVYGWVKQFVATEQPDLIFTYTSGTLDGLDSLLSEIRRRTTAEIIVPSLHFRPPPGTITPEEIAHGMGVDWDKVREICAKHGAEFVENRKEMAEYITKEHLQMDDLLFDHNHQNLHGRIRIWDNVSAHLVASATPAYAPEALERRLSVAPATNIAKGQVSLSGAWQTDHGVIHTHAVGARLTVRFTGNQINVLGRKSADGGKVQVTVDGVPGQEAPVFVMDYIQPSQKHAWRIPHAVELGGHPIPQTWTFTMTSDVGDYRLVGSVTGPDGEGQVTKPFRSNSGQVSLPPRFWRQTVIEKKGAPPEYGVAKGDSFTFDVYRGAVGELNFQAPESAEFAESVARNLSNGPHTVELTTTGSGDVAITGLYVYEPLEK